MRWEVATDRRFRKVVRSGDVRDRPQPRPHRQGRRDRAEAGDLVLLPLPAPRPAAAAVGRTRTAPAPDATPDHLRFGVVSCANLQAGWFTAYRALARRDDLHAVLHLGDYLYEYAPGQYGYGFDEADIRPHEPGARDGLAGRLPAAARAVQDRPRPAGPARGVPLDHHLGRPRGHQRPVGRAARRTTRRPARATTRPAGPARTARTTSGCRSGWTAPPGCSDGDRLFRRLRFGRLAEISMLDLRSYRSEQVQTDAPDAGARPTRPRSATRRAPSPASSRCSGSRTRCDRIGPQWKVIGNPVMIAPVDLRRRARRDPRPDQRRHRAAARGRPPLQRRPVGRLHRRPARGVQAHQRTTRSPTRCSSPATSTPAGRASCPTTRRPTPPATRPGVEFVCTSVTSNNLKDITGTPPRTASIAVEAGDPGQQPAHQVPQLRRPRLLGPRHHQPARPDGLVRHRRPRRPEHRRSPGRGRWRPSPAPASCTRSPGRWARDRERRSRTAWRRSPPGAVPSSRPGGAGAAASRPPRRPSPRPRQRRASRGSRRRRAYVLVVDGCRPDEIDEGLTPNLLALRDGGLRYPRASSMPVMETIPNHVMMMTGVRPGPLRRAGQLDLRPDARRRRATWTAPSDIKVAHRHRAAQPGRLPDRHGAQQGVPLRRLRRARATHRWEPQPIVPVSGHAPDQFTMEAALAMLEEFDPHLMFVNLGDIDRVGHTDLTGPLGIKAARRAALADTDAQVGRFVDALKSVGPVGALDRDRAGRPLDGLVGARRTSSRSPRALEADPLLAGKVADRRQRRRRPPLLDRPRVREGRGGRPDARGRDHRARRAGDPRADQPVAAASAPRPATSWSSARPAGGSATRTRSPPTRSPATTATRRPGRSRSSSAAAPRSSRAARPRRGTPAPSTSRRPWRRSSASARAQGRVRRVQPALIGG